MNDVIAFVGPIIINADRIGHLRNAPIWVQTIILSALIIGLVVSIFGLWFAIKK